jgi:hypothetical protein
MSVSKSIVGCVTANLEDRGELHSGRLATDFVPRLAGTGYDGATGNVRLLENAVRLLENAKDREEHSGVSTTGPAKPTCSDGYANGRPAREWPI